MHELSVADYSKVSGGFLGGLVAGIIVGKIVEHYIGDELDKAVAGMLDETDNYDGMRTAP